ncbi:MULTISPECIES: transcriptional regulator [Acinetobacter]|uniref:Transcriptional regulator n=1 Tax=Acinetobacter piscicola TaxID=2006115 RepID=A0A4Q4GRU9_9GAMM|nr:MULTISPECIES: transcriptional regulator [Acinetobacter]QOW46029.1 transcriptional regulator [Acinetobacter piscicola]RYL22209.1 transcriptional regulator [Acinetobacter piscicola]
MTLKEKILFLKSKGYTQQTIQLKTGIKQSSVSRILSSIQKSVQYEKGAALDALVNEISNTNKEATNQAVA